eukprot:10719983-Heterocapsa_arctica.AAC.1
MCVCSFCLSLPLSLFVPAAVFNVERSRRQQKSIVIHSFARLSRVSRLLELSSAAFFSPSGV